MIKQKKAPKTTRKAKATKVRKIKVAPSVNPNETYIDKTPLVESETVINRYGDDEEFTIGTNNQTLVKHLLELKKPERIYSGGFYSFKFNFKEFNLSFIPTRKRRKKLDKQV